MSTGHKKKRTKFTFQSLIRLIIFSVVVFFVISLISDQKTDSLKSVDSTLFIDENKSGYILGKTTEIGSDIYNKIPPKSREQLENLNQSQAVIFIQEKINLVKEESKDFPQKQIKEIQKMIVKNVYDNTIKNIDSQ